jgi:hypothetical protein
MVIEIKFSQMAVKLVKEHLENKYKVKVSKAKAWMGLPERQYIIALGMKPCLALT